MRASPLDTARNSHITILKNVHANSSSSPSVYKAFLSARPVYSAVSSSELLVRFVVRIKGKKEDKVSSRSFHGIMESCGNSAMRSGCILYIKS